MAWGANGSGQLGTGTSSSFSDVPVRVTGLSAVRAISAGGEHSLALLSDGTLRAWGRNNNGQLGTGQLSSSPVPVPVTVKGVSGASAISAGGAHSVAVATGGKVWAWGSNNSGQLGNGNIEITSNPTPRPVVGLAGATAVSAGDAYSLALLSNGTAVGWGDDSIGELGNGFNPPFFTVPVKVANLTTATALTASDAAPEFGAPRGQPSGSEVSLALLADHTVDDWGATRTQNEAPKPTGSRHLPSAALRSWPLP